jgi:hypothetical protein
MADSVTSDVHSAASGWVRWGPIVGLVVGLSALGISVVERKPPEPRPAHVEQPQDAVARVNGVALTLAAFDRHVALLRADGRQFPDPDRFVIDRFIDEELLIQEGIALDLVRSSPAVRSTLLNELIAAVTAGVDAQPITDEEIDRFLVTQAPYFAADDRLHVRAWVHPSDADDARLPVPDGPVPTSKLRDYLPAEAIRRVSASEPGSIIAIPADGGRELRVQLVARSSAPARSESERRSAAREEVIRQRREAAVRTYLDGLRHGARIERQDLASLAR